MATAAPPEAFADRLLRTENAAERRALIAETALSAEALREAVLRLEVEAERLHSANPGRAEQMARDALALAGRAADPYLEAIARRRLGDALRVQSRNEDARHELDRAAALFTSLGRSVDAARTRITWVVATSSLGMAAEARATARATRPVLLAAGELARVATLDQAIGFTYMQEGRYRLAATSFGRAVRVFAALGADGRLNAARSRQNHGLALVRLGRFQEGLTDLEQARDIYHALDQQLGVAFAAMSIGEQYQGLGKYAPALRSFEEAGEVFRRLGTSGSEVALARNLADCYVQLNRPADALASLDAAADAIARVTIPRQALGVAVLRVTALIQTGRVSEALATIEDTDARYPAGTLELRCRLALQRAAILRSANDLDAALNHAQRAMRLARASGFRSLRAEARLCLGDVLLARGDLSGAGRAATTGRRIATLADMPALRYHAHELAGRIAEAGGAISSARRHYAQAIGQLEREQRGVIFAHRAGFAEDRNTVYERLAVLQLAHGDARAAWRTVERAKSRALAEAIAGTLDVIPRRAWRPNLRAVAARLAAAREEYAAASRARSDTEPDAGAGRVELAAIEERISTLLTRLQVLGAGDGIAALIGGPSDATPDLPPGTALVEFFRSGDDLLRLVVVGNRVQGALLRGGARESERLVRAFRLNLDAAERAHSNGADLAALSRQARLALGRLYDFLLREVLDGTAYQALVVVPHGVLHYLPFHALHDGARYLIERLPVSYAPSAALYTACQERGQSGRHQGRALVLAHSSGGALPSVTDEAVAVGAVLRAIVRTEEMATRGALRSAGSNARTVHIAAHGRFRPDAPLFSAIELADGPLTVADVFSLRLRAELVTLSACETGRAVLGGGDELEGLARAFLYAGAGALVVSQWRVEDTTTAMLMARFYRAVAAGAGQAAALRTAQTACLNSKDALPGRSHPLYWAGFQLIGDGLGQSRPGHPRKE